MANRAPRFSPFLKQCFVTSAVGLNLVAHGSVGGFPAILLPQLHEADSAIVSSKTLDSWIASVLAITIFFGCFITPPIMDRCGRKAAHYVISASSAVGWLLTALAWNIEVILTARVITGLSFGMMVPLRSALIGEYTSPVNRGAFLTTISLTMGLGIFLVHCIGSLLSWYKTALIILFLPLTSFIMTIFIPESPSYLVSKEKYDDCKQVFRWLRGDKEEEELQAMIQAKIELSIRNKDQKKINIVGNIRRQEFYKPIILMMHLNAVGQICGTAITAAYSTTIIKQIVNPSINADLWMVVLDIERILVNTLAIFITKRFKRRTLLFTSFGICMCSMSAIAGYVYSKTLGFLTYDILWIPGALMFMQFFAIGVALVPLPNVLAGEVYPLQYRSIAGTISAISTSCSMFVLLKTFPFLTETIGISKTYVLYACAMTYCMIVTWIMLPETKDRTLQDIEDEYRGRVANKDAEESEKLNNTIN